MGKTTTVFVRPDGTIEYLYNDKLDRLPAVAGPATICRASHVEPDPDVPGTWFVDLSPSGGPLQTGFATRAAALRWEEEWLNSHSLGRNPG